MVKSEINLADAVSKSRGSQSDGRSLASFLSQASRVINLKDLHGDGGDLNLDVEQVEVGEQMKEEKPLPKRDQVRRKGSKVSTYKREEICRQVFEDYFDDYFPTCRPKFLANPETGRPLELDGYNAARNISFETNGVQHYEYHPRFHKDEDDFHRQQRRDQYKAQRLAELGINLVEIPYTVPTEQIPEFIHQRLRELGY